MAPDAEGRDETEVEEQVLPSDQQEDDARATARGRLELVRISYEDSMTSGVNALLPPNMRSLKGRVQHYATRANLQLDEIVDCGRVGPGGEQRFTIKSGVMRPLRDTVRCMQLVLDSLRSSHPDQKAASQIDPSEAFLKRLDRAASLEELQLAWVGITNRLANSQKIYQKYWTEALRHAGDDSAEILTQPASTPSTVYRTIDREEDETRRLRLALGGLPSSRASALNQDRVGDTQRFLSQPLEDLLRVETPLREAFPPRESAENTMLRFYDDEGRPHEIPPNTTHNNPLDFDPSAPIGDTEVEPPGFFVEKERPKRSEKSQKKGRPSAFGLLGLNTVEEEDEEEGGGGDEDGAPPPDPPSKPSATAGGSRRPRKGGAASAGRPGGGPDDEYDDSVTCAYSKNPPLVNPVIKPSDLPQWDGNRGRAVQYFATIVELARNGGHLPRALGEWLWTRLTPFSEIHQWYLTQSEERRDFMRLSYRNYIDTIKKHYLGEAWVEDLDTQFRMQRFRDHKNPRESPTEWIYRRIQLCRILGYAPENTVAEARLLMSAAPKGWKLTITFATVKSTDDLAARINEFADDLVDTYKRNKATEAGDERAAGRTSWRSSASGAPRTSQAMEAELEPIEGSEDDEAERGNPASGGGNLDFVATAYSVARSQINKRTPSPMFPPANHVRSKGKKPPPGPCFACGSPFHWNKDCPHWDEYQERRSKESFSVELDAAGQAAYDSAYTLIVEQGFDEATHTFPGEREAECKSYEHEEGGEERKEEGEVTRREVFIASTPAFFERVEEIAEEYWHCGECLPADSLYDLEYIYAEAEEEGKLEGRGMRAEINRVEESEGEINEELRALKPYDPPMIRLRPRKRAARGQRLDVSVLNVRGRIGSKDDPVTDLRLDSGANLTLVSGRYYDSSAHPRRITQGEPMQLQQLTSKDTPIRGTTRMEISIEADDGTPIEMDWDVYVVDGMTVDVLLGEDFQQAFGVSVSRAIGAEGERTEITFAGAAEHPVTAVGVQRTKDYDRVSKSYVGIIPDASFARKGHFKRIRQHRRQQKEKARIADSLVRADQDVRLPPHTCVKIRVEGPFSKDEEWVVEKLILAGTADQLLAVPNTILSTDDPYVPIANPSDTPRIVRKGDVVGRAYRADKFFDSPTSRDEKSRWEEHAARIASLVELQSQVGKTPPRAKEERFMPDAEHYEEWKGNPRPVKVRFRMPTADSYAAWSEGRDPGRQEQVSEDEDYGPKTAAMPDTSEISSQQFREVLDVGALPDHLKERAWEMLEKRKRAFGLDGRLGNYPAKATIRTHEGQVPISVPMHSASPAKRAVIDEQIDKWFEQGVIEASRSPWGAPVVIAYRNGKARFCVDYRRLNSVTIPDEFPIPRQSDILASLSGSQVLSSLDALSGFTQLEMDPADVEKTAFRTHRGLFQFRRMPFGLRNGPSIFQRVMQSVLAPYLWIFALVYIDDIVVYSRSFEEHIEHLDQVLGAVERAGLTLSPTKCHLFYDSIILLGHKVSRLGLSTHQEKVKAVLELAQPTKLSELQTFLGMTVYFSSFIPYYADVCSPLHRLLRKGVAWDWGPEEEYAFLQAKTALQRAPVLGHPQDGKPYRLYTDASDRALGCALQQVQAIKIRDLAGTKLYDRLKKAHAAGSPPPRLVTKLSEKVDDAKYAKAWAPDFEDTEVFVERVIAYWSRTFKGAEERYSTTEREALAAKEGLVKFQPYIEGGTILLVTDHSALQWARTYENSNRRLATWGAVFAAYRPGLEIIHRPGRVHSNVDPLSRIPRDPPAHVSPVLDRGPSLSTDEAAALMHEEAMRREPARRAFAAAFLTDCLEEPPVAFATTRSQARRQARGGADSTEEHDAQEQDTSREPAAEPDPPKESTDETDYGDDDFTPGPGYEGVYSRLPAILLHMDESEKEEFVRAYQAEQYWATRWRDANSSDEWTPGRRYHRTDDGLLFFLDADYHPRLCVPDKLVPKILKIAHEEPMESAHGGAAKVYAKLRRKFYWKWMGPAVEKFCQSCDVCQKVKYDNFTKYGTLIPNPIPLSPYDSVSMDFIVGLPPSYGFTAILVAVDRLTKHAQFIPAPPGLDRKVTADLFARNVVARFGLPNSIIADRDKRWTSDFWRELAKQLRTKMMLSSAHHPQHDGQTEVLNRQLETMLRAYVAADTTQWAAILHLLEFAYNASVHKSTGEAPFKLLYGKIPRSPMDAAYEAKARGEQTLDKEAEEVMEMLDRARQAARDAIAAAQDEQAKSYNKGRRPAPYFKAGERVLVNSHSLEWVEAEKKPKLKQRWIGPFEVAQRVSPNTYRLHMGEKYPGFPVFNIAHLKKYRESSVGDQVERATLPETRGDEMQSEEYEVEKIVGHKWDKRKKKRVYKVRWVGYGPFYDTWQTESDLRNADEYLRSYKKNNNLP